MKKIAIQGVEGCYHEMAAKNYFKNENIKTVECLSFPEMFNSFKQDRNLFGVMAIENTIAGPLLQNHELLRNSDMKIIGEYKLHISHTLAALPGETIDDIIEVNSHPIALMQCTDFLDKYKNLKLVEKGDTASSAKEISRNNLKGHAAICSEYAANLYNLNILFKEIETNKRNFTRFLVLADKWAADDLINTHNVNKASVVFCVPHIEGSLSKVLTTLYFYNMNLTKIQSTPIIGREWEYRFYLDLKFDDYAGYKKAIEAIRPFTKDFNIIGEYKEFETKE